ncbi:DUF4116 domain-containing protein [Clostridioides difficile]
MNTHTAKVFKYVNWDELEGGFSKAQIEELCLIAVMEDGLTLEYVTEQTPKICIEALKQNKYAIKYVKDKEKYEKMFDLKYLESQGDASEVFAIKENGEWLFTISYKEDLTKKEFVDYIYNTGGGFDLRLGVNIYKQIYFDFFRTI